MPNIKLSGPISDVYGVSGQAMLRALIEGEETPAEMARRGRVRCKQGALEVALDGRLATASRA